MTSPSRQVPNQHSTSWSWLLAHHLTSKQSGSPIYSPTMFILKPSISCHSLLAFCFQRSTISEVLFMLAINLSSMQRLWITFYKARMVTSFAIPHIENIEYLCLPFIPEARPLTMTCRILHSMSPSNSLNYFHSLTSVSSSWSSHRFFLHSSYSTQNMPVLSCLIHQHLLGMQKKLYNQNSQLPGVAFMAASL